MAKDTSNQNGTGRSVYIRRATANDQESIRKIVRAARLFPFRLQWPAFLVAEDRGTVVGAAQIRRHNDGCRELASLVVQPAYQRYGIGSALVTTLLAGETGPIYLMCAVERYLPARKTGEDLESYYMRFGFSTIPSNCAPHSLGRLVRIGNRLLALSGWGTRRRRMVLVMRWTPDQNHPQTRQAP